MEKTNKRSILDGPDFPLEKIRNAKTVLTNIGLTAMKKNFHEEAVNIFDLAESITKHSLQKVPICIFKSKAYLAMAEMEDSRFEALKALAYDTNETKETFLNLASLLYNENQFEESLTKYSKGKFSDKPAFNRGKHMVLSTLKQNIGSEAGKMFDANLLGNVVRKIKKENLGLGKPPKYLSYDQMLARQVTLKQRKKYLASRYLGRIAPDRIYLDQLADTKVVLSTPEMEEKFKDVLQDTVQKLDLKEKALWSRRPLYLFYNKIRAFASSGRAKAMEQRKKQLNRTMLHHNIIKQIKRLHQLKLNKDYATCYYKTLRLSRELEYISEDILPIKNDCKTTIYEIMGDMYLTNKILLPKLSDELNDIRIKYFLGVCRIEWPSNFSDILHVEVKNVKKLIYRFAGELERSIDYNEQAFLNNELACLLSLKPGNGAESRSYAFNTLIAAKKANNTIWYLQSLFLIARSAFTDNKYDEGVLTLVAAKLACEKYGRLKQATFIDRALLLLQHLKPEDFLPGPETANFEDRLGDIMPTEKLKDKVARIMITIKDMPTWRRMQPLEYVKDKEPAEESQQPEKQEVQEISLQYRRPPPSEKMPDCELIQVKPDRWITGFDDYVPYRLKDIMPDEQKLKLISTVHKEKRYSQFLSVTGRAKDFYRPKRK